jgi:hypothetical protein
MGLRRATVDWWRGRVVRHVAGRALAATAGWRVRAGPPIGACCAASMTGLAPMRGPAAEPRRRSGGSGGRRTGSTAGVVGEREEHVIGGGKHIGESCRRGRNTIGI